MSAEELEKSSGDHFQEPAVRCWKSVEAAEAAAGLRPGPPAYWEQWAERPQNERGSEIDWAITAGLGFTSTHREDEKYEDGARRLLLCAKAANDLALEIRAEHARKSDEAAVVHVTRGKGLPPPTDSTKRARANLFRLMKMCKRWDGSWFPIFQLMSGMKGLSEQEFRRPIDVGGDDEEQFARLALNLRRVVEVFRYMATRSERPTKGGRPLNFERIKMIRFARRKGYSLRQLARQIVELGCNANRSLRPSRTVLNLRVTTDDAGALVSAKGKAVPNPEFCDDEGRPIPEEEFQQLLADWKDEQTAVWEDRLRSAEVGQSRPRRRGRKSAK